MNNNPTPGWGGAIVDRLTVVHDVHQPTIPPGAHVTTMVISLAPGDPGLPPHRHPGPTFGYILEGEMNFEIEGQPPRIIRAGEAFWEPGGDTIHHQGANNRTDAWLRFLVTTMIAPEDLSDPTRIADQQELASREHLPPW
jgi:quercetin dioxygenase-like cupin family protein